MAGIDEQFGVFEDGTPGWWIICRPNPVLFPPPWRGVPVWHPGGWYSGTRQQVQGKAQDLADAGILAVAPDYRLDDALAPPQYLDGQTLPAYFPDQLDDCKLAVDALRALPDCNGQVGGLGGSSGATHAAHLAFIGYIDAAFCMSAAYNFANLVNLADNELPLPFRLGVGAYSQVSAACLLDDGDCDPADIAKLVAASPMTQVTGNNISTSFFIASEGDAVHPEQLADIIAKMIAMGVTNYQAMEIPGSLHAFNYWGQAVNGVTVRDMAIAFFLENLTPPVEPPAPPVENNLLGYRMTLTGQLGEPQPGIIPSAIHKDALVAQISGLAPSTPYRVGLLAYNQYGDGPATYFDFISDPAIAGILKTRRKGTYNLMPGGDMSGYTNTGFHPFWDLDYVDGSRARTGWNFIQPDNETDYFWDDIDDYLAFCVTKSKYAGIGLGAGLNSPPWLFALPGMEGFVEHAPDPGEIPVPWNPVFLQKWIATITAYGLRYDAHPNLAYVTIGGLGQIMETYVAVDAEDYVDLNSRAIRDGFSGAVEGWTFAAQQIIAAHAAAFPTTHILITAAKPFPNPDGNPAIVNVIDWMTNILRGFQERMGVMNAGLNGGTTAEGSPVNQAISDLRGTFFTGYQFGHTSGNPACDPTQPQPPLPGYDAELGLINTLDAGIAQGVEFIEIYESDIKNSLPSGTNYDPEYEAIITDAQTALKLN